MGILISDTFVVTLITFVLCLALALTRTSFVVSFVSEDFEVTTPLPKVRTLRKTPDGVQHRTLG